MKHKINLSKTIVYVALGFQAGVSDLVLSVRKPDTTTIAPAFVEQGSGIYVASYVPDAVGNWQETVTSVLNGDKVVRSFDVVPYDLTDIKTQNDTIEGKVDAVDGKVDTANGKLDVVDGKVDTLQTTANSIETKVDALDLSINSGGYFA